MLGCWELEPNGRPSFSDLVSSLSRVLEAMAGYMDVGAFGQLQVQPLKSESGDGTRVGEQPKDHGSSEKESKADEITAVKYEETSM